MSTRLDVLTAVLALVRSALPQAEVFGLGNGDEAPARVGPGGRAIVRSGDPGSPEIDLSPPAYHYDHRIPVELTALKSATQTSEQVVDAMAAAIGAAVAADPTLGGLCSWIEPTALLTGDIAATGAAAPRGGDLAIVASYSSPTPLS